MKPMRLWLGMVLWLSSLSTAAAHTLASVDAGRGGVPVLLPDDYRADRPVALIVSLHGFGGTGDSYIQYWKKNGLVDARGFIVVAPTGTTDSRGRAFWNASKACCDKDQSGVDDASYLRSLIEAMLSTYAIDPRRIHVTGYSNGGFMAHRMACEHPDTIASIVSVAGAGVSQDRTCHKSPVHVLQVHGTEDAVIRYGGGQLKNYGSSERVAHPGAVQTVSFWASHNGASPVAGPIPPMDLSERTPGAETQVMRLERADSPTVTVELWSMTGETHVPQMNDNFHARVTDWMLSHPKASAE